MSSNLITSKINPDIVYEYNSKINKIDHNYSSKIFTVMIGENNYEITLGRTIFRKGTPKSVFYYNIYLVLNNETEKIGVFEVEYDIYVLNELYNTNEIEFEKLNSPLFYPQQFKKHFPNLDISKFNKKQNDNDDILKPKKLNLDIQSIDDLKVEDLEPMRLNTDTNERPFNRDIIDERIEEISNSEDLTQNTKEKMLSEETFEDYKKMQDSFVKRNEDNWIQKRMRNRNYRIIDNADDDTSLFEAISKALDDEDITSNRLREYIVDMITDEDYLKYKKTISSLKEEMRNLEKKIKEIKTPDEREPGGENLIMKFNKQRDKSEQISKLKETFKTKEAYLKKMEFMDQVNSLDELKNVIMSDDYWGDNFAISLLERLMTDEKIKIIVFLEDMQKNSDEAKIVSCNNYNSIDLEPQKSVKPKKYIILSLTETRYRLVTYRNKSLLSFKELPYGLKRRLIDNCTNVL